MKSAQLITRHFDVAPSGLGLISYLRLSANLVLAKPKAAEKRAKLALNKLPKRVRLTSLAEEINAVCNSPIGKLERTSLYVIIKNF